MSIGKNFLERVLNEGKKDDTKGFTFDRSVEAMKRVMRDIGGSNNFADKIAEVASMFGIPGMYLNKPDVREGVVEAAQELKSKATRVRAFLALHSALSSFYGIAPVKIEEGLEASEEDKLEGSLFQKMIEEILVSLGIPPAMVENEAKPGIKSGLKRAIAKLRSDENVRAAAKLYALRSDIAFNDKVIGGKKAKKAKEMTMEELEEAVAMRSMGTMNSAGEQSGTDRDPNKVGPGVAGYLEAAKAICVAFGVPEMVLEKSSVITLMKHAALKDSASGTARRLMDKLVTELNKRN